MVSVFYFSYTTRLPRFFASYKSVTVSKKIIVIQMCLFFCLNLYRTLKGAVSDVSEKSASVFREE